MNGPSWCRGVMSCRRGQGQWFSDKQWKDDDDGVAWNCENGEKQVMVIHDEENLPTVLDKIDSVAATWFDMSVAAVAAT